MSLAPGIRLGPYEVLAPLGAGGMGEVFRARDTRLGREVAVKVLPDQLAGDPKALARFESEARAVAALSHPNILALFDVGEADGVRYAVTELLEGETLRALVTRGAVPVKRALEIAAQVASALAAAHEKGILHRDVKPENVFLTRDGHVKLLDFGLARHTPVLESGSDTRSPTEAAVTDTGAIVGTVAYMSPEQARGLPLDHRSDQFSLGVVLYEMVSGRRAFRGDTPADTLAAIIRDEPEPLSSAAPIPPPPVRWIVDRCLAKEPGERYDSTRDLAREIAACRAHVSEAYAPDNASSANAPPSRAPAQRRVLRAAILVLAVAAAGLAGLVAGRRLAERPAPTFSKLTFFPGIVGTARFTPDGSGVVYFRRSSTEEFGLFSTRVDGPASFALEPRKAQGVFGVHGGEMAIFVGGSLALVPLGGGTPREVMKDVGPADWGPDGKSFAVVRNVGATRRLEYPVGKVLFETAGGIDTPRVSPDGTRVVFGHRPHRSTWGSAVCVASRDGPVRVLSEGWDGVWGVAWSPSGREVWFGAGKIWGWSELHAVDLEGRRRTLLPTHALFELRDVRQDGAVLLGAGWYKNESWGTPPGETEARNVSWFDATGVLGIAADGSATLHYETSLGGGEGQSGYLRRYDGSSPIRLGAGKFLGLSRDGGLALARDSGNVLHVVPTGPGERRSFPWGARTILSAEFFPGDERALVLAAEPGRPYRLFVQDLAGGPARPLGPEGVEIAIPGRPVSPDGRLVAAFRRATPIEPVFVEVASGAVRPIPGLVPGEKPLAWGADAQTLFVRALASGRSPGPPARTDTISIDRLDLRTGKRQPWRELRPPDGGSGLASFVYDPAISEDGRAYFYTVMRSASDLYLVQGLR